MKLSLLFFALVLAAAPAFAGEDSNLEKAIKADVVKNADKEDVKKAVQVDALKKADKEDVKDAAKVKMLRDKKD